MQEVSGSSPLSSTPGQRPFSRSRERAFLVPRGSLRGKIVAAPCGLPHRLGLRVSYAKSSCGRYPLARLAAARYAQLRTTSARSHGNDWKMMAAKRPRVLRGLRQRGRPAGRLRATDGHQFALTRPGDVHAHSQSRKSSQRSRPPSSGARARSSLLTYACRSSASVCSVLTASRRPRRPRHPARGPGLSMLKKITVPLS